MSVNQSVSQSACQPASQLASQRASLPAYPSIHPSVMAIKPYSINQVSHDQSGTCQMTQIILDSKSSPTHLKFQYWLVGRLDGWMDGWIDRWTDAQLDRQTDICKHACTQCHCQMRNKHGNMLPTDTVNWWVSVLISLAEFVVVTH